MKYYIYVHKRKDNGIVFYVGKGTKCRAKRSGKCRSAAWRAVVEEAGGFDVAILHDNLTEQEALDCEQGLLRNPPKNWELVNKHKANSVKSINYDEIKDLYYYDPTSKTGLRYKIPPKNTRKLTGDEAGTLEKLGYYTVKLHGFRLYVHRIIYVLCYGTLSKNAVIDHIDGNRANNKIENLRSVTQKENTLNRRNTKISNTGIKGIYFHTNKSGNSYYSVVWVKNDKQQRKSFSILKLGMEQALEAALNFQKEIGVNNEFI